MGKEIEEMTSERIKQIQSETAYPQSVSVQQSLLKVWNECKQSQQQKIEQLEKEVEDLNRLLETQNEEQVEILVDKALKNEENTKLKEQVKELEEVLRGWLSCNYSESQNIDRTKEVLMNGRLTK